MKQAFNGHLSVITRVKSLDIIDNKIIADGKVICDVKQLSKTKDLKDDIELKDNGDLYINNKLYSKNVKRIVDFSKRNVFFIYNDNWVENYLSPQMSDVRMKKYDKVLDGENYLITLKNNTVTIYYYILCANGGATLNIEDTYSMIFEEIDDVEIECLKVSTEEYYEYVILYKNNQKIKMPILGIFKET